MALLTFSTNWPWAEPTGFEFLIETGGKRHTIRSGASWFSGRKIHHWMGSPRNRSSNPKALLLPFHRSSWWKLIQPPEGIDKGVYDSDEMALIFPGAVTVPHLVAVPVCYAVEKITICNRGNGLMVFVGETCEPHTMLMGDELRDLIHNDGFTSAVDFERFFYKTGFIEGANQIFEFTGQLVHWTEGCLYNHKEADVLAA